MLDLACSLALLAALIAALAAHQRRRLRGDLTRSARVEQAGLSPLLGRGLMEMTYGLIEPVARGCVRRGISANTITALSFAFGVAAGAALALGRFGVAALLTAISSLGDALDGAVARRSGTASSAGEIFDAAVDRYEEIFFLGGLALFYRDDAVKLGLVLGALAGSFMVSYGTAKAEALGVTVPRGALRRAERAVALGVGAWLSPIVHALVARYALPPFFADAPMLAALALIAVGANVSAVRRLAQMQAAVAARADLDPSPDLTPHPDLTPQSPRCAQERIGWVRSEEKP